ncbi:MAG: lipoyl(octanoyl) transferase LipB, partial [Candidatus Omnitrophica bacterium]|nr:lipoyl(octanoyl) transferase LipB [Candidatus Omnitrophota bacterium]
GIRYFGSLDTIILCQHRNTFTQGRSSKNNNILISQLEIERLGIDFYAVDRGGDITYHGPGQLVVYPIFDLARYKKDLKYFLTQLEDIIIRFLRMYNISCERKCGFTGVWVGDKKIASIGIAVKKWIAYHGIAININPDLRYFSYIKPCGLDIKMTSAAEVLNREIRIDQGLKQNLLDKFKEVFPINFIERGNDERSFTS